MINFGQLEARVRVLFESTSTTRWATEDFLRAANEGLDELSEETGFYERFLTIHLRGGQTYYDVRGYLPENLVRISFVFNNQHQVWCTPLGVEDITTPRWETVPGDPVRYLVRGVYWLGIYPRPSGDVGSIRVYYDGVAPHFRDSASVLVSDFPDDYLDALESYILYDLTGRDGETDKSLGHWADFYKRQEQLAAFVERRTVRARRARFSSAPSGYPSL